jgi:hypothetical protein
MKFGAEVTEFVKLTATRGKRKKFSGQSDANATATLQ